MKLNLRNSILAAALMVAPSLVNAQEITSAVEDGYVSDPSVVTVNNPYTHGDIKLGMSDAQGAGNSTSAILPFKLPSKSDAQTVKDASLKVYVSYGREWISANIDLYGLSYATAEQGHHISSADHFAGDFASIQGDRAVGIEDDYFAKNVDAGNLDTERWEETSADGNVALAAYINAQYEAGAKEGDWIFLRMSVDNEASAGAHYFMVTGGESTTPPTLNITMEGDDNSMSVSNNKTETLNIFPNPTVSGNFSISTEGLSNNSVIEVYNVTGQQVASEVIDASASVYNVELGLVKGLYIVKVIDGANVSTQKLIVE